ncbi:serine protease family S28 [Thraustotheca clavata]|uniref:Serine protease family S28 n=1 Tax=Thraustotheca clavata TaxID=74557 RepID=A0A1W0A960_9STRA|nr:serine protease family S28 [Thraustotheca clavata]
MATAKSPLRGFNSHQVVEMQYDAPLPAPLQKNVAFHPGFNPHENLKHVVSKYEKLGIEMDEMENVVPQFFQRAIVDHTATKHAYWKQRYYLNKEYWGGDGFPVFLMVGGESPIAPTDVSQEMFYMNTLAIKHKALMVSLEHRYYGTSYPTKDMSVKNLKYLSIAQALKDVEIFHNFLTKENKLQNSKWIAFGGSYPGNLAAWLKQAYPKLFIGSIASSAPIHLKPNFQEYMEIVGKGLFAYGGNECVNSVKSSMSALHTAVVAVINDPSDETLSSTINLCGAIKSKQDAIAFEVNVMAQFQTIAQYNDYSPVKLGDLCDYMTKTAKNETPLTKVAGFLAMISEGACIPSTYRGSKDSIIDSLKNTKFDGESADRQWTYQRCTELGYTQTTTSNNSPFAPLEFVTFESVGIELCKDVFGKEFAFPNVASVDKQLRGLDIQVNNVTFTNGYIDPWHPLGISKDSQIPPGSNDLVIIKDGAHCRDMYAPQDNDTSTIKQAHEKIGKNVALYLS